jgi:hypothetical protein
MTRTRRVLAGTSALALVILFASSVAPVGAADPASESAASAAVAWLKTQQQADGSFEVAGFPGFETRDAALAIAEDAQTSTTWNPALARAAVEALRFGGSGPTPLDYLEGLVAGSNDPGVAAKTVVLVSEPLGIDATTFGPVDLLAKIGGCTGTSAPTFNGLLYLVLAQQLLCGSATSDSIAAVRAAQQANGGWGFLGDPTAGDIDVDTTALAVEGLAGSGALPSDPAVRGALLLLAENHQPSGAWQSFGADDPNSTAMAIIAVTAAGYDVTSPCWRNSVAPSLAGSPYASPDTWLRSQQVTAGTDAGRVQSPSDSFGVNTIATTQTVEALLRSWLPVTRAARQACTTTGPPPVLSNPRPTAGESVTISGDGFGPGATLTIELQSDPILLATVVADPTGAYTATVTIPADTPPGTHQIVVSGVGPDGQPRVSTVTIEVLAAATNTGTGATGATGTPTTPSTGTSGTGTTGTGATGTPLPRFTG